jgi:hypothetical protein
VDEPAVARSGGVSDLYMALGSTSTVVYIHSLGTGEYGYWIKYIGNYDAGLRRFGKYWEMAIIGTRRKLVSRLDTVRHSRPISISDFRLRGEP